ncbi:MAG TPA: ribonuclease III [Planctomycetes bacterium]|nr:ribonuclease III [Planctomycetota bacterium]
MAYTPEELGEAERIIGHKFRDAKVLEDALTHSSATRGGTSPNERLETLGDAVLTLIITETLFAMNADADQGAITTAKSALVSTRTLAGLCRESGLAGVARYGKSLARRIPMRVGANVLEAVIGAVYLDGGIGAARSMILRLYGGHIKDPAYSEQDPKSRLQQVCHERFGTAPSYEVVNVSGPPHNRVFRVRAVIAGRGYPEAEAGSKKSAERRAARFAIERLNKEADTA